ncbi:hypothetical protein [Chitinimonas sp.]|uniref:hypothetical protein n=1 Tax=Chitinimonas sp. TaxID=1934313 RepID=UPI002F94DCCC
MWVARFALLATGALALQVLAEEAPADSPATPIEVLAAKKLAVNYSGGFYRYAKLVQTESRGSLQYAFAIYRRDGQPSPMRLLVSDGEREVEAPRRLGSLYTIPVDDEIAKAGGVLLFDRKSTEIALGTGTFAPAGDIATLTYGQVKQSIADYQKVRSALSFKERLLTASTPDYLICSTSDVAGVKIEAEGKEVATVPFKAAAERLQRMVRLPGLRCAEVPTDEGYPDLARVVAPAQSTALLQMYRF